MSKIDLKYRSQEEEIMDDLSDGSDALYRALEELDIINKWLGGNAITLDSAKDFISEYQKKRALVIADLGCGSGEMLKRLAQFCRKKNIKASFHGFDANPNVIAFAQRNCHEYPEIEFYQENILEAEFQSRKFDLLLCTLFLHHFSDEVLVRLLQQFKSQSKQVLINDLHRNWFAYYSIKWITAIFSRSSMVKNDACLSVWRAFKKQEWVSLLEQANIKEYSISWRWAFRWKLQF